MKKIAIILSDITLNRGTERAVCNLATMLSNSGKYYVSIVSCYSGKTAKSYYKIPENVNIVNIALKRKNLVQRILQYFILFIKIKKILINENIDIIIGTTHALNIICSFLPTKIKKIACEHMNYFACPKYSRILRKLRYSKIDRLVTLTQRDRSNYIFLDKKKLFVIPNSLSFTCNEPSEVVNKTILAVGGLSSEKGFDNLIDMAIIFKEKIPDWHIDIFGEGELKEYLSERIKQNKVEDFVFLRGATNNIKEEYRKSSIYVMTSKFECFPMVLLEAQTCGIPVVAFDCNYGPADIIEDGKTGYLIPVGENITFIEKVIKLSKDYELRKQFGNKGIQNSMKYSSDRIFNLWDDLIENLIKK